MISRLIPAALISLLVASPAWAHECPKHMEAIDEAMVEKTLELDDAERVIELRDEGEELHDEGDHEGSVEALEKAREILEI